jgi:D-arabinose 1-dehydrogenase-like Zn-dependent alcohol dehydrogenase
MAGHLTIMYAKAMGYRVTACKIRTCLCLPGADHSLTVDITEEKLKLALDSGADNAYNSLTIKDEDIVKSRSTIVISGAKQAFDLAFKTTQFHGRVIAVGYPYASVPVDGRSHPISEENRLTRAQFCK